MKRFALVTAAVIALAGCAGQQTETTEQTAVEPAVTAPVAAEKSELLLLWERHCNREALSVEEMQTIANSEMPAELTGKCFSK